MRDTATLVPIGVALNLTLATIVHALKLPLYVDAVGTIAVTLLSGLRAGILTGVLSFVIGGIVLDPVLPWFACTQIAIAAYTHVLGKRGWFRSIPRTVIAGMGLGIVAGVVSAPVIAILFGGITGAGTSLIVAFLLKSGQGLYKSVLLSGLASEPLDKAIQAFLAVWLLRGMPKSMLRRFRGGSLMENGLVVEAA
jgi:energy-coupling factor transport system substrate-specific component